MDLSGCVLPVPWYLTIPPWITQLTAEQVTEVLTTRQIIVKGSATTIPFKYSDAHENKNAMVFCLFVSCWL